MSTTAETSSVNLRIWNQLRRLPFGNKIFSQAVLPQGAVLP